MPPRPAAWQSTGADDCAATGRSKKFRERPIAARGFVGKRDICHRMVHSHRENVRNRHCNRARGACIVAIALYLTAAIMQ